MSIDYDHSKGSHPLSVPQAAIPLIFSNGMPQSILDIGCGIGTWLKVSKDLGVMDIFGVDGVQIPTNQLLIPNKFFKQQDLTLPMNLGRKFEAVICLEVAEHLPEKHASTLIDSLVRHSDTIIFSAGAPGQDGQNHINCQWPDYWQKKFNECGYICSDDLRWRIWNDKRIDPWYRQNIFIAQRNLEQASKEPRIASVIHPECFEVMISGRFSEQIKKFGEGGQPMLWYVKSLFNAIRIRV